ncbi:RGCVC family protein [Actinophytocola xinjiangensis]|uniref:RGCVC family protein n=1 Tax=Actinophytocola xinjiangensis TaxID=485602 RepID=UPI00138FC629|nr:RGCVC family protein [Actinophytocola xinjiangensis]
MAPDVANGSTADEPADRCAVCSHPLSEHDPIAARFCTATAAGGYSRGCVCAP